MSENIPEQLPKCIGFIPDGNRRWARANHLETLTGHKKGEKKLEEVMHWCKELDIRHVVIYAFSTENWNRPKREVVYLSRLFRNMLEEQKKNGDPDTSIHFLGDPSDFGEELGVEARALEETTRGRAFHQYLAFSYGGRAEIMAGIKKLMRDNDAADIDGLSEEDFEKYLTSAEVPEPDLIVRTSGEKRLSGFLTWKSIYSELAFVDSLWPAFSKEEFLEVLQDYAGRKRRRGK